jgi:valine--pyruvate aminotransferase
MRDVKWSAVGTQFDRNSATRQLMDDLGHVQRAGAALINLGGGNPARVPAVQEYFAQRLADLAMARSLDNAMAAYDDPMGPAAFRTTFAAFLRAECGWPVDTDNVLCTAGSQASLFMLFNALGGPDARGRLRRILLPQSPEYIGYESLCFAPDALRTVDSRLVVTAAHRFRYELDRTRVQLDDDTAAVCLSRPANPTGQVCADDDMAWLGAESARREVPLIVDCA